MLRFLLRDGASQLCPARAGRGHGGASARWRCPSPSAPPPRSCGRCESRGRLEAASIARLRLASSRRRVADGPDNAEGMPEMKLDGPITPSASELARRPATPARDRSRRALSRGPGLQAPGRGRRPGPGHPRPAPGPRRHAGGGAGRLPALHRAGSRCWAPRAAAPSCASDSPSGAASPPRMRRSGTAMSGPAPVTLADYERIVRAQSRRLQPLTRERVHAAFADTVIRPSLLDRLGPAVNSGRPLFVYGPAGHRQELHRPAAEPPAGAARAGAPRHRGRREHGALPGPRRSPQPGVRRIPARSCCTRGSTGATPCASGRRSSPAAS